MYLFGHAAAGMTIAAGTGDPSLAFGIAKGFDRKQDELVYDKSDHELARLVHAFKPLLQRLRDEAHRLAISWHRRKRAKTFLA